MDSWLLITPYFLQYKDNNFFLFPMGFFCLDQQIRHQNGVLYPFKVPFAGLDSPALHFSSATY